MEVQRSALRRRGQRAPPGDAALTSIAHIGVHLRRFTDEPDGSVFEIMVALSMAGILWSRFAASAAGAGCRVPVDRGTGRG